MLSKFRMLPVFLAPILISGCVSTAEGILDSVAGTAAKAGSSVLFNAKEEECLGDPALLAEKAVDLEFYKEKSFNLAKSQCDSKFDVAVNEALFSQNYDEAIRESCFSDSGDRLNTRFCSEAAKNLSATTVQAPAKTSLTSSRDYKVVSLECDHEMFKRKPNLAPDAQIIVDSSACEKDGRCYDKANLVDGNRSLSPSPSFSWSNDPNSQRRVDFVWDTPLTNVEQIYIVTPHTVPILNYTIEITTPDHNQIQMVRVLGNKEQKLCHRFNPIDVKSMFITGLGSEINQDRIYLNEIVIR